MRKRLFVAFKGATMYEAQVGRLWVTVLQWRFYRVGVRPLIRWGWERKEQ